MELDAISFQPQDIDKSLLKSAIEAEEKLIEIAGLKSNYDVHCFDAKFNYHGENHIHTIKAGDSNPVDMVILHGYGGSGITFYRMLKQLSKSYRVFCIDLLGMGLSSKPKFSLQKPEHIINFFIDTLELWRKAVGLDRFHLVGHSLGGYLGAQYALKFPQHILKLSLISPAGITKENNQETEDEVLNNLGFFTRMLFKFRFKMWRRKITPHLAMRSSSFIGKTLLRKIVSKRFNLPEEEVKWLCQYLESIFLMADSTEKCIYALLKPPRAAAILPLEEKLHDLGVDCDFYYGDIDWMDWTGEYRLADKNKEKFQVFWVTNAGHNIHFNNPIKLTETLIKNSEHILFQGKNTVISITTKETTIIVENNLEKNKGQSQFCSNTLQNIDFQQKSLTLIFSRSGSFKLI